MSFSDLFILASNNKNENPGEYKDNKRCEVIWDKSRYNNLTKIKNWRGMLSNDYISPFTLDGKRWNTVEHYYQGAKFRDLTHKLKYKYFKSFSLNSESEYNKDAQKAKIQATNTEESKSKISIQNDFYNGIDKAVLMLALFAKFSQHEELKNALLNTNEAALFFYDSKENFQQYKELEKVRACIRLSDSKYNLFEVSQFSPKIINKVIGTTVFPVKQYTDLDILLSNDTTELFRSTESFKNLNNYTKEIDKLGGISSQGFVRKLTYVSNGKTYHVAQKNAGKKHSDSLVYEYLVGLCINEFAKYYPCFPKTYMIGMYYSLMDWGLFKNASVTTRKLDGDLKFSIKILDDKNLPSLIKNGCRNNEYICIFSQFLPVKYNFDEFISSLSQKDTKIILTKNRMRLYTIVAILHIMYTVLSSLATHFTHYDLHHENVVLIEAPVNQHFNIRFHLKDKRVVEYKTDYLPVFIDFGRSFVDCQNLNSLLNKSDEIIKTVCKYDDTNLEKTERACPAKCGSLSGYKFNPDFNYSTGLFDKQIEENFFIDPTRHNISHDIKFLCYIEKYIDFTQVKDGSYMDKTFLSDFLPKLAELDNIYGTRENLNISKDKIYNVIGASESLTNIVSNQEFNLGNDKLFVGKTVYKTIDMWAGEELTNEFSVM